MANREVLLKALKSASADNNQEAVDSIVSQLQQIDAGASGPAIDKDVMVESQKRREEDMSFGDWLSETAFTGSTEGIAGLSAVATAIGTAPFSDKGFMEILSETFNENQKTAQMLLEDIGFERNKYTETELRKADPTGGIIHSGVKAVADPVSYVGAPLKAGQMGLRAVESLVAGSMADIGGQAGEALTDSPYGGLAGAIVAGGAVPTMTAPPRQRIVKATAAKATDLVDKIEEARTVKNMSAEEFDLTYAGRSAQNLLKDAAQEAGADNIEELIKNYNGIKETLQIDNVPLIVTMSDNEVLRNKFAEMAKRNPQLRSRIENEIDTLVTAISNNADTLFGGRNVDFVGAQPNAELLRNANKADKAVDAISMRMQDLGSKLRTTATDQEIGTKIQGLVQKKSEAVRASLSPKYKEVIDEATKAGAVLPPEGTKAIYNFVKDNGLRDIFGKGTQLDRKILSYLAPKQVEVKGTLDPLGLRGPSPAKTVSEFKAMSFENVDSLKSAINKLQRDVKDNAMQFKLSRLEDIVDEQRKLIGGDFNDRLKAVDLEFYQKVGIPFDNKTIKDLNTRGYAEQVAPVLMRNPSAARQFLETVGPDGLEVLEHTVMSKMYQKAVSPVGIISQSALERAIKDNSEVIDLVPGLRDRLDNIAATNSSELRAYKAAQDELADSEALVKASRELARNPNLQIAFEDAAKMTRQGYVRFMDQVNMLDPQSKALMMDRLRREVYATATTSETGAIKFLTDPNKSYVMNELFGTKYLEDLKKVGKLSDALKAADPESIRLNARPEDYDEVNRRLGFSAKRAFSVGRDRIMSVPQKVFVLLSASNSSRMEQATDKRMMELFLDPDGIDKMAKIARRIEDNKAKGIAIDWSKEINDAKDIMARRVVAFNSSAIARELSRQETEEQMRAEREANRQPPQPVMNPFADVPPPVYSGSNPFEGMQPSPQAKPLDWMKTQ